VLQSQSLRQVSSHSAALNQHSQSDIFAVDLTDCDHAAVAVEIQTGAVDGAAANQVFESGV
jgi:hypothetical protein